MFVVYWLHDIVGGRVKIGLTDNLKRRIREIEREFSCEVAVVRAEHRTTRGEAHRLESALHWHHRELALGREWFRMPIIDTDCGMVLRDYGESRVIEVRPPRALYQRLESLSIEQAIELALAKAPEVLG